MKKLTICLTLLAVSLVFANTVSAGSKAFYQKEGKRPLILTTQHNTGSIQADVDKISILITEIVELAGYTKSNDFVFTNWNDVHLPGSSIEKPRQGFDYEVIGVASRISYAGADSAPPDSPIIHYFGGASSDETYGLMQIIKYIK